MAIQSIPAQDKGAVALTVTRQELRDGLTKEGEKAARGMARVLKRAVEEMTSDEWETPEEELDRHLGVLPFDEWSRLPRKYIEPAPGVVSTPELVYKWYAEAKHVVITIRGVARRLGITEKMLHEWIKHKPLLATALRAGCDLQEERLASRMASGIKYPQSIFAVLKNLHHWTDKVEETHKVDFLEALQAAQAQAKRVQWDKASPPPLLIQPAPPVVIDAQIADSPLPSSLESRPPQAGGGAEGSMESSKEQTP